SSSASSNATEFCAQRRQFALRFIPKQTKLHFSHIQFELIQRDETTPGFCRAGGAASSPSPSDKKGSSMRKRGSNSASPTTDAHMIPPSLAPYSPFAVLHILRL